MRPVLTDGAIAQLGERLHGMQEVCGSIPHSSTKFFWSPYIGDRFYTSRYAPAHTR